MRGYTTFTFQMKDGTEVTGFVLHGTDCLGGRNALLTLEAIIQRRGATLVVLDDLMQESDKARRLRTSDIAGVRIA